MLERMWLRLDGDPPRPVRSRTGGQDVQSSTAVAGLHLAVLDAAPAACAGGQPAGGRPVALGKGSPINPAEPHTIHPSLRAQTGGSRPASPDRPGMRGPVTHAQCGSARTIRRRRPVGPPHRTPIPVPTRPPASPPGCTRTSPKRPPERPQLRSCRKCGSGR